MNFVAAWRSAWKALAANALRSLLTMLGIIIGVAAVITMMAVGRGATDRVQAQMKGKRLLSVCQSWRSPVAGEGRAAEGARLIVILLGRGAPDSVACEGASQTAGRSTRRIKSA